LVHQTRLADTTIAKDDDLFQSVSTMPGSYQRGAAGYC